MKTSPSISRRSFLKSTVALGTAVPFILPSRVWAADPGPNDQIALGFIGLGTQGRGLMGSFLRRTECRVVAVCDVDTTRRESAKKTVEEQYARRAPNGGYKGCDAYNDYRELLARTDIQGVVIATPDHWHALNTLAAAKSGKDIYCEKPMAHTVLEGRAMVNAVRQSQRVLQVGSMQRSSREFHAACELIRNGAIGTVRKVEVAVGGPAVPCNLPEQPLEPGLDWNLWLGPAPLRPYNEVLSPRGVHRHFPEWRSYREYAGGGVADWGAHHFDIAHWALGFDDSGPVEIFPAARPDAKSGVRLLYATGVEILHQSGNGVTFHGDKGRLHVNRGKFELWLGEQQKASSPAECAKMLTELLPPNPVKLYQSSDHHSDWLNSMRTRKPPICDVEIGHRTATVCNLVNAVYYSGQRVKWDPVAERFGAGTGNPKWLDRDYRAPWKLG